MKCGFGALKFMCGVVFVWCSKVSVWCGLCSAVQLQSWAVYIWCNLYMLYHGVVWCTAISVLCGFYAICFWCSMLSAGRFSFSDMDFWCWEFGAVLLWCCALFCPFSAFSVQYGALLGNAVLIQCSFGAVQFWCDAVFCCFGAVKFWCSTVQFQCSFGVVFAISVWFWHGAVLVWGSGGSRRLVGRAENRGARLPGVMARVLAGRSVVAYEGF